MVCGRCCGERAEVRALGRGRRDGGTRAAGPRRCRPAPCGAWRTQPRLWSRLAAAHAPGSGEPGVWRNRLRIRRAARTRLRDAHTRCGRLRLVGVAGGFCGRGHDSVRTAGRAASFCGSVDLVLQQYSPFSNNLFVFFYYTSTTTITRCRACPSRRRAANSPAGNNADSPKWHTAPDLVVVPEEGAS